MRTKVILTSFALAAALVGCTDDELATTGANKVESQSGMIDLDENFMIGAVGVNGATTRTHWELTSEGGLDNVFSPIAVAAGGNNQIAVNSSSTPQLVDAPSIGLCWVGQSVGDAVYTNYEFYHNGWLGKDQTTAVFDPCDASVLKNGWLYSDLELSAAAADGEEAVKASGLSSGSVTSIAAAPKVDEKDLTTPLELEGMNLNSGVYKTENKTIFGGNYIAYYPYNPDFKDTGTIPATSMVAFDGLRKNDPADFKLAENTFRYTNVASINGGDQAKGFQFKNLSGVIRLVLKSKSNSALNASVDQVVLYSASSAFKKQVRLNAAKINAGATGTALFASTEETSKTISITMESANNLSVVAGNASGAALADGTVYLTALPGTVSDLVVLAHDVDTKKWAECEIGSIEIPAGQGREIVASFAEDDFKPVHYAIDQTSLTAAINACAGATDQNPATIKVLGDIVLSAATTITNYVTVEGDKIIVPYGTSLTLDDNATIKSTVDVQGQDCCLSGAAGTMEVKSATIAGVVNILAGPEDKDPGKLKFTKEKGSEVSGTINNYGAIVVGDNTSTAQTLVSLSGTINNSGTLDIKKGATGVSTEDAKIAVLEGGNFNNQDGGVTTVEGVLAVLPGQASNEGTIYDKVSSQITGNISDLNGEYICDVDDNGTRFEAALNERPTTIIRFIKENTSFAMNKVTGSVRANSITKYIVAATGVTFTADDEVSSTKLLIPVTISNLEIEAGKNLTVTTDNSSVDALNLTVKGTINVAGTMTINVSKDRNTEVFNAGNVIVKSATTQQGVLNISKNVKSTFGSLTIDGVNSSSATASNSGSATFELNSITNVTGAIVNKGYGLIKLASSGTADVSARVWYDTVAPTGNGLWANGTPTKVVR